VASTATFSLSRLREHGVNECGRSGSDTSVATLFDPSDRLVEPGSKMLLGNSSRSFFNVSD
jgi:hypothetical protein